MNFAGCGTGRLILRFEASLGGLHNGAISCRGGRLLVLVVVRVDTTVMNTMAKETWGRVYSVSTSASQFIVKGRAGTWRQLM